MKILNWVHRKFHQHNVDRYMVSPKQDHFPNNVVAQSEIVTAETDTKALLELNDVWKDGILSIGTLGYQYSLTEEEEEEEEKEEYEQFKQLVIKPSPAAREKTTSEKSETETTISKISVSSDHEVTPDTTPLLPETTCLKKRVTLADLLSEEKVAVQMSGEKKKISVDLGKTDKISAGIEKKTLLSFGKKKKDKGEQGRSKRNLQRMISKMLKKKIYPDIEGKFNGKDETKDAPKKFTDGVQRNNGNTIEMASLL